MNLRGGVSRACKTRWVCKNEQRQIASDALRSFAGWLRDALLVQVGMAQVTAIPAHGRSMADWFSRAPHDHLPRTVAQAQRRQLLIDLKLNPRIAMEILLLDFRVAAR